MRLPGASSGSGTAPPRRGAEALSEFLDHPYPLAIAHRGGNGPHPENTMAAFEHALSLGYRYIETDVHATRDGVAVAFHDPDLRRLGALPARIRELSWADLRRVRLGGREPIARVVELLDAWPGVRVNLDPKSDRALDPLLAAIRDTGAWSRVCIGSFSGRRLARARRAAPPALCTSAGPGEVAAVRLSSLLPQARPGAPERERGNGGRSDGGLRESVLARARRALLGGVLPDPRNAHCLQVPIRHRGLRVIDRAFVARAHALGLRVHAWTVNDPAAMRALLDMGVDGIMTDELEILREVLRSRGAWTDP